MFQGEHFVYANISLTILLYICIHKLDAFIYSRVMQYSLTHVFLRTYFLQSCVSIHDFVVVSLLLFLILDAISFRLCVGPLCVCRSFAWKTLRKQHVVFYSFASCASIEYCVWVWIYSTGTKEQRCARFTKLLMIIMMIVKWFQGKDAPKLMSITNNDCRHFTFCIL